MKKFFCVTVAALCCVAAFFCGRAFGARTETLTTSLTVKVTDLDGAPIANAKVFVPENGASVMTDENGSTPPVIVPFAVTELSRSCGGDISFVTVAVTKDGYVDAVLFNCLVFKDRMRNGPVISLFDKNQTSAPFVATVEVPPDEQTKALLAKAKGC